MLPARAVLLCLSLIIFGVWYAKLFYKENMNSKISF